MVVAIIGIFSAMSIVKFKNNGQQSNLNTNALVFLDSLQNARNWALTGKRVNNETPISYGLVVADSFNFNGQPNHSCAGGCLFASTTLELIYLSEVDILNDIVVTPEGAGEMRVDFKLPRANTIILLDRLTATAVKIQLNYFTDNRCVEVNSVSGRMDVGGCD